MLFGPFAVPGVGEAVPGVGEAVPGVAEAVPGVGEAVPGFGEVLPGVPVCPGLDAVPGVWPLGEAGRAPVWPALDPAAEPGDPADPACPVSGVNRVADNTEAYEMRLAVADWATNQNARSNKTDIIEILVFMGLEASKRGVTPRLRSLWSLGLWFGSENPVNSLGFARRFGMATAIPRKR